MKWNANTGNAHCREDTRKDKNSQIWLNWVLAEFITCREVLVKKINGLSNIGCKLYILMQVVSLMHCFQKDQSPLISKIGHWLILHNFKDSKAIFNWAQR